MNLNNDSYIKRTIGGDKALLEKPPIPFKKRILLHEIPKLGNRKYFKKEELLKVSDLYVNLNYQDPIAFFKLINEVFEENWIAIVEKHEIEPSNIEEDKIDEESLQLKTELYDINPIYKNLDNNVEENINKEEEIQKKDEQEILEEKKDSQDESMNEISIDIERWVEKNKEEEKVEEVEIPWTNPFLTLDDYLKSEEPEKAYKKERKPIKKEFIKEEKNNNFSGKNVWDENDNADNYTSMSKTKEEKFKEQMDLLKAEKRRNNRKVTDKNKNSKNKKEDNIISNFIKILFKK